MNSSVNLLSSRMQALGLTPWLTNCWAMLVGATILSVASLALGLPFAAYLSLVGRLGPERAAYCTVLFPVVALTISTIFEGYQWSMAAFAGLALVFVGNMLAFLPVGPGRRVSVGAIGTLCR